MSDLRLDMLLLLMVIAGAAIAGIYLFMLAVPRNDEEHLHDSIGERGHMRTQILKSLARLRRRFTR